MQENFWKTGTAKQNNCIRHFPLQRLKQHLKEYKDSANENH